MQFVGGFMAVKQDPKIFALRSELSWAVVEASNAKPFHTIHNTFTTLIPMC